MERGDEIRVGIGEAVFDRLGWRFRRAALEGGRIGRQRRRGSQGAAEDLGQGHRRQDRCIRSTPGCGRAAPGAQPRAGRTAGAAVTPELAAATDRAGAGRICEHGREDSGDRSAAAAGLGQQLGGDGTVGPEADSSIRAKEQRDACPGTLGHQIRRIQSTPPTAGAAEVSVFCRL